MNARAIVITSVLFVICAVSWYLLDINETTTAIDNDIDLSRKVNQANDILNLAETSSDDVQSSRSTHSELEMSSANSIVNEGNVDDKKSSIIEGLLKNPPNDEAYKEHLVKEAQHAALEISEHLQLTAEVSGALKSILEEKTIIEYEIIKQDRHYTETIFELQKHQHNFEAKIRNELDSNEILAYEQFEFKKALKLHHKRIAASLSKKLATMESLSQAQQEEITLAYNSIDLPPDERFSIGVYGTYYGKFRSMVLNRGWYRKELTLVNSRFE
ncbi:hypothetical protein DRW07_01965 [Alteromonas sediminis]|uniref:Uncharacterized protein n=1 Tax=Alteromonas sediminis TaxID=2259342 RepID=A0A3N5ZDJ6_9ALTE|nr:hypothetical protein [Alteromonas sediminis]RPJ68198.1 hypothetical protein DRW07_01965 [Alteromonas sediminis]